MAGRSGLALRSCRSATSRIISSSRSRLVCSLAETGTITVSPPQSSASRPRSASCCLMRSGCASGLSILLIATMIGTSAARAWSMASSVCGITPSSAATTSTTISVTLAPRGAHARERFVARRIDEDDLAAVLLHVIRADVLGDAAGFLLRDVGDADGIEQRSLAVIDVAHDGDHWRALDQVLLLLRPPRFPASLPLRKLMVLVEAPKSRASSLASLESSVWLMVAKILRSTSFLITRFGFDVQLFGKLFDRDAFRDGDFASDRRRPGFDLPALRAAVTFSSRSDRAASRWVRAVCRDAARWPFGRRRRNRRLQARAKWDACGRGPRDGRRTRQDRAPGLGTSGCPGRMGPR